MKMTSIARPPSAVQPVTAARPGTASRLAAQAAASSKPPSTARPGTGRTGTGAAPGSTGGGVPSDRLRTGRMLQSARGRPGIRNTRDRAYFIAALRSKLSDIINETNRLRNESRESSALRDLSATTHGEYQALLKTVTDLRGTQHDYEAMLESVAKGVTNDDIQAEIEDLQQQNGYLTGEVQELLNERENREGQLKKLQDRSKKYETAGDALLREMSEEDQRRYREMQRELNQQTETEDRLLGDHDAIRTGQRAKVEEELVFSPLKREAAQVHGRIRELQSTLNDMKEQTGRSPDQEQLRLMEEIKQENNEIAAFQRQSHTLQDVLETLQQSLGGSGRPSAIQPGRRDDERQQFLAGYRDRHSQITNELNRSQEENLRLLDQLSKNVSALNELPISTEADLMKSGQQLRSAVGQVKQEQRLREDLLQMNADERSRELRKLETEKKEALVNLERKKTVLRSSLDKVTGDIRKHQRALENSTSHQKITAAEHQLSQISARTFEMEEVVAGASAHGSFESRKLVVLQKAKQVNEMLQRLAQFDKIPFAE